MYATADEFVYPFEMQTYTTQFKTNGILRYGTVSGTGYRGSLSDASPQCAPAPGFPELR